MRQYSFKSSDFVNGDDPTIPDCYVSPDDAGIREAQGLPPTHPLPNIQPSDKGTIQRENKIKAGTPEWFKLWGYGGAR